MVLINQEEIYDIWTKHDKYRYFELEDIPDQVSALVKILNSEAITKYFIKENNLTDVCNVIFYTIKDDHSWNMEDEQSCISLYVNLISKGGSEVIQKIVGKMWSNANLPKDRITFDLSDHWFQARKERKRGYLHRYN